MRGPRQPSAGRDDDFTVVTELADRGREVRAARRELRLEARDGAPLVAVERRPVDGRARGRALLVHGLRGSRASFELSGRSLPAYLVAEGLEVVTAELRGSGASGRAGSPAPRSVAELAELDMPPLVELAARGGGELPAILVGHSLGALLCCIAAARARDRVAAVVALAPPFSPGAGQRLVRLASRLFLAAVATGPGRAALASASTARLLVLGRRLLDRWPLPPRSRTVWPGSMEPELEAELERLAGAEPGFPLLLADLARPAAGLELEGVSVAGELGRLDVPLLCLVGDRDEIVPPAAALPVAEIVGTSIREVRIVGDDGGHVGHADVVLGSRAPELVWEPALRWLEAQNLLEAVGKPIGGDSRQPVEGG